MYLYTTRALCNCTVHNGGPGQGSRTFLPGQGLTPARYQTRLVRESARRARTAAYLSRYVPVRDDSLS